MRIDVTPTLETMENMSKTLRYYADKLDRTAERMRTSKDLSYAGEAMGDISNCIANLRLDLLVTRPLRAYQELILE